MNRVQRPGRKRAGRAAGRQNLKGSRVGTARGRAEEQVHRGAGEEGSNPQPPEARSAEITARRFTVAHQGGPSLDETGVSLFMHCFLHHESPGKG